jgi:hypothetical protein
MLKKIWKKYRKKGDLDLLVKETTYSKAMIRKVIDGDRENGYISEKVKTLMERNQIECKVLTIK